MSSNLFFVFHSIIINLPSIFYMMIMCILTAISLNLVQPDKHPIEDTTVQTYTKAKSGIYIPEIFLTNKYDYISISSNKCNSSLFCLSRGLHSLFLIYIWGIFIQRFGLKAETITVIV